MSTPKRLPTVVPVIAALFSIIYLINPTAGLLELIPDNIPFFGNLDEAGVTALLIWAINELRAGSAPTPRAPRDVSPPYDR